MFLVISFNHTRAKNIVYISDNDPKTIKEAAELHCGEIDAFLYDDELYDITDIENYFEDDEDCQDDEGEFDWDKFEEQLEEGNISLNGEIDCIATIDVIDSDCLELDEDGDF